ncbi:hypothetical protein [uncultured Demequina sp.]|uniref:hypothetical protein n=1 Tax=uncultured Demequina sp. TaxID=693499 RepID=UPI0025DE0071|nr:hypothetical protein [uncultured Demequina sp.]
MTVTEPQLRSAAALVAVVPGIVCRLTTAGGACMIAGSADDAEVCGTTFREMVIRGDASAASATERLDLDGVAPATGLAATPGARYFVSPLPSRQTTDALRECDAVTAPYFAMARADAELGVSVVRVSRAGTSLDRATNESDPDLDEVALAAFSSCLVAHLIATTDAV